MASKNICRTCFVSIEDLDYLSLYCVGSEQILATLRHVVEDFDAEIVKNAVLCKSCISELNAIQKFHDMCVRNERKLSFHVKQRKIQRQLSYIDLLQISNSEESHQKETNKTSDTYKNIAAEEFIKEETEINGKSYSNDQSCKAQTETQHIEDSKEESQQQEINNTSDKYNNITVEEFIKEESQIKWNSYDDMSCEAQTDIEHHDSTDSVGYKPEIGQLEPFNGEQGYRSKGMLPSEQPIASWVCQKRFKQKRYTCNMCGKYFSSSRSMVMHRRSHSDVKQFVCELCNTEFVTTFDLAVHMQTHTSEKAFKCNLCAKSFIEKNRLEAHLQAHRAENSFECGVCEMKFVGKNSLIQHMKIHSVKPYICEICYKGYEFQEHVCTHTFSCGVCTKAFRRKVALEVHMKSHTSEKRFKCHICNKSYLYKTNLENHFKYHLGDTKFECEICTKKFVLERQLQTHMYTHAWNKPFKCTKCPKSFLRKTELRRHRVAHSSLKRFECHKCSKRYFFKSTLNKHLHMHSEGKPFECEICGKQTGRKEALVGHMKKHLDKKPHTCDICGQIFLLKTELTRHICAVRRNCPETFVDSSCAETCEVEGFDVKILNSEL